MQIWVEIEYLSIPKLQVTSVNNNDKDVETSYRIKKLVMCVLANAVLLIVIAGVSCETISYKLKHLVLALCHVG